MRGAIEGRIDAIYYSASNTLKIVNNTTYTIKKLGQVANMERGRFSHRPRNEPKFFSGKYPFIQTGDVVKASNGFEKITFSQTLNELGLGVSKLFRPKVIVITIAANIGDTAILDYPACFPDSLVAITPKIDDLDIEYLNIYLKYLKTYLENLAPQSAQKNINLQQLAPTPIIIPPPNIQYKIVSIFKLACQTKQAKEQKAKELLAGIDSYLLDKLGIKPATPEKETKRSFFVRFSKVHGGRLDANFYKSEFQSVLNSITQGKTKKLGKIIDISTETWDGKTYFEDTFPYIEISEVDIKTGEIKNISEVKLEEAPSRAKMIVRNDDIIVSTTRPSRGAISYIKQEEGEIKIASTGFAVLRGLKTSEILKEYLFHALRQDFVLKQMEQRSSGGNYPAITIDELKNVLVPIPNLQTQAQIVEYINNVYKQARELEAEAKAEVEKAKAEVEKMILG